MGFEDRCATRLHMEGIDGPSHVYSEAFRFVAIS